MTMKQQDIIQDWVSKVNSFRKQGLGMDEIANHFGVTKYSLESKAKKLKAKGFYIVPYSSEDISGFHTKYSYDWDALDPKILEMMGKGLSLTQISQRIKIRQATLLSHVRRHEFLTKKEAWLKEKEPEESAPPPAKKISRAEFGEAPLPYGHPLTWGAISQEPPPPFGS